MLWRRQGRLQLSPIIKLDDKEFKFVNKVKNEKPRINAAEIILLLLSISPIKGNTKLQKQVFLTWKQFLYKKNIELGYRPYKYGAYSELIDDVVKNLHIENKINIERRRGEGTIFSINQKGKEELKKITNHRKTSSYKLLKLKNKFGDKLEDKKIDWDEWSAEGILRYTYRNFPEYTIKTMVPLLKW